MLESLNAIAERVSRAAVWAGGAMLLAAAALVSVDVIARKLLGVTFGGSDEISGYLFAVSTSWAFAFVLLHRANVRIDAVYLVLGRQIRAVLDLIALLVLGGFMGFFSWRAWIALETTISMGSRANTPLGTPLIIPQSLWVAGLVLFMLVWVVVLLRTVAALIAGDLAGVNKAAGVTTQDEEVEEELALHQPGSARGP